MSGITTHVLDLARGRPAAGIVVVLSARQGKEWRELGRVATDADGRVRSFPAAGPLGAGIHQLRFETGEYFAAQGVESFWPHVEIAFQVDVPVTDHHVPLLLSPYGFSTYRGS